MSEQRQLKIPFTRDDGFVDEGRKYNDPILKEYTLVEKVVHINPENPEDFIIENVPKVVHEYNIDKEIHEAAKGTDLKSLVLQILRTGGDISQFDISNANCGDASMIANDAIDPLADAIEATKGVSPEILAMTPEEFNNYVNSLINGYKDGKNQTESNKTEGADVEAEKVNEPVPEEKGE